MPMDIAIRVWGRAGRKTGLEDGAGGTGVRMHRRSYGEKAGNQAAGCVDFPAFGA